MSKSDINRKFERFLPGLKTAEDKHLRTTEAEGRWAADRERNLRHEELTQGTKYKLIWIVKYDFENKTETFIPAPIKTENNNK